ncbi:mitochondrial fission ELM1 family protein [Futiania mangrovi]|uniref:Mitochondrial fission ELM1 family protein n=1 Tax=Futiania mangrovi TaxID=2959716 RepID=A0A9J6PDD8_9PROT|nr:mitochondrial fission ELM1 family protein [Futiania mangrovii]MCP1337405.1 mitochondrial fission ELM1 family protein [Futiania mangrovii]
MIRVWIVTDDKAGNEMPARGLAGRVAERTPCEIVLKRVAPGGIWRRLPPALWQVRGARAGGFPFTTLPGEQRAALAPPWPDLAIGCGRLAAPFVAAIGRLSAGTATVQILDPHVPERCFDLLVVPEHDGREGARVLSVTGSLTRITPESVAAAAAEQAERFARLPRPLVAVLIGGSSKAHRMSAAATDRLIEGLQALQRDAGAGLAVTLSRRTGDDNAARIRKALTGPDTFVWDGTGPNPYPAMLGAADAVVVTEDSVNMVSEAASAGKPALVAALEGGSAKMARFHARMRDLGLTRPFAGRLETWTPPPFDETARAADAVLGILRKKNAGPRGPGKSNREDSRLGDVR